MADRARVLVFDMGRRSYFRANVVRRDIPWSSAKLACETVLRAYWCAGCTPAVLLLRLGRVFLFSLPEHVDGNLEIQKEYQLPNSAAPYFSPAATAKSS